MLFFFPASGAGAVGSGFIDAPLRGPPAGEVVPVSRTGGEETAATAPGAPTGLIAVSAGESAIYLRWEAPADTGSSAVTGYRIENLEILTDTWTVLVANTNSTGTDYTHTGLDPETFWVYRVSAVNASGPGTASATASASTSVPGAPGSPFNLVARPEGNTGIRLTWDAPVDQGSSAITGYKIERKQPGDFGIWETLSANTGDTKTEFEDTGLTGGREYTYRVSAVNNAGVSPPSREAAGTAGGGGTSQAPGAPTGLKATADGDTAIDLAWDAPSDTGSSAIAGYLIEVSEDDGANWSDLEANTNSTATSYRHTGLQAGSRRSYRVSAINASGPGSPSGTATATTGSPGAPAAPTNLIANASSETTIELAWDAPSDTGSSAITGYRIEVSEDGGTVWTDLEANTNSTATAYSHGGLQVGSERHYRVSAINAGGTGPPSEVAGATTVAAGAPGRPTSLAAMADGETAIDLSWGPPADSGASAITGYRIQVSEDGGATWTDLVRDTESTATDYSHSGLSPGTTRHYRVFAINDSGTGLPSDIATARTAGGEQVPGMPAGLTATALGQTEIELEWTPPSDSGSSAITGYQVEVSADGGANWTTVASNTGSTKTSYTHSGLQPGTTRHYRVAAINDAGTGPPSPIAHATTLSGTLGAPTGLVAVAQGSSQIDLTWIAPTGDGGSPITGYRIEVSSNGGLSWFVMVANTNSTATSYSHAGLAPGTTRHYRVSAINANGDVGPASNVDHATTGIDTSGAPTNLTATANGSSRIDLSWAAPSNDGGSAVTGYRIQVSVPDDPTWTTLVDNTGSAATTYSHTNLPPASTWSYRVAAINASGTGPDSEPVTATTDPEVPDPPTDLTAVTRGSSWIQLSWKAPIVTGGVELTGYRIEVYDDANSLWTPLESDTRNTATQYHHLDLEPGETWHYRVSAINELGVGEPSNVVQATTDAVVPDAPTHLVANANGASEIDLEWRAPDYTGGAAVTGYLIEVFRENEGQWRTLEENTRTTATEYTHRGLEPASRWHYRVSAINSAGAGPPSKMANATTDPVVPDAPTALIATANGATRIELQWRAPDDDGGARVTGFRIEVSENAGATWTDRVADTRSTGTAYPDVGLPPGTTLHYRVSAINAAGVGEPSNVAFATTQATVPDPPTGLSAAARDHSRIDLAWSVPDFDGGSRVFGYRVEVSENGRDWTDLAANTGSTNTFHAHTGLPPAATRFYRVSAINEIGTGRQSNVASATTDATVPDPPTDLVATAAAPTRIDLDWDAPEYDGGAPVTSYRIEVSNDGSGWSDLDTTGDALTSYSHTGLVPGSTRHYRVSAINTAGAGMPSNVASATTDDPVERAGRVNEAVLPHFAAAMTTSTLSAIAGRVEAVAGGHAPATRTGTTAFASLVGAARRQGPRRDLNTARLIDGMSFHLPLRSRSEDARFDPMSGLSTWGGAESHTMGQPEGEATRWDGDMLSVHVGTDVRLRRDLLVGVAGSRSSGTYDFTDLTGAREVEGSYEALMTSVNPYLAWVPDGTGLAVWAAGSFGWGEVAVEDEFAARRASDTRMTTGALGGSRVVLSSGVASLRLRAEGWLSRVDVLGGEEMDSLELRMRRARLSLEWSQAHLFETGQEVRVLVEGGVRHGDGDGTDGTGMEVGAGLRYVSVSQRLKMEGRARVLVSGKEGYEEWGVSGLIQIDPQAGDRGLSMRIVPAWGEAASGLRELWEHGVANRPDGSAFMGRGRVNATVEYGLPEFQGRPYGRFNLAEGGAARAFGTGMRYEVNRAFALRFEGTRTVNGGRPSNHGLALAGRWRF